MEGYELFWTNLPLYIIPKQLTTVPGGPSQPVWWMFGPPLFLRVAKPVDSLCLCGVSSSWLTAENAGSQARGLPLFLQGSKRLDTAENAGCHTLVHTWTPAVSAGCRRLGARPECGIEPLLTISKRVKPNGWSQYERTM